MKKKILAILLCVCMLVPMLPETNQVKAETDVVYVWGTDVTAGDY